jgi:alpha-D-xyloside xylohydrolase
MTFLNPLATLCLTYLLLTLFLCVAEQATSPKSTKISQGYRLISIEDAPNGAITGLLQVKEKNDIYGPDIPLLRFYVK